MTDKISGSCLCGKVEFEVENQFENLFFCHCKQCRKISGSAHASNLFGNPDSLKWVAGKENVTHFSYPGRQFTNAFCKDCGAGMPFLSGDKTRIIVQAGALDTEPNFSNKASMFCAEKAEWHQTADNTNSFEGFPEG